MGMKRSLCLLAALVLILAGCGSKGQDVPSLRLSDVLGQQEGAVATVSGYGQTAELTEEETARLLEELGQLTFTTADDPGDLDAPGGITVTISICTSGGAEQVVTLPHYAHDGQVYKTGDGYLDLVRPFLEG